MLSMLELNNFKSFKKTGEVKISPITLISGQNSSGKSSLLQSILAIKQTIESPYTEEPLILNGAYVSLGEFQDILNCYANKKENIRFAFKFNYENEKKHQFDDPGIENDVRVSEIKLSIDFAKPDPDNLEITGNAPTLVQSLISFKVENEEIEVLMRRNKRFVRTMKDKYNTDKSINFDDRKTGYKFIVSNKIKGNPQVVFMSKFLPSHFFKPIQKELINTRNELLNKIINFTLLSLKINESPMHHKFSTSLRLREIIKKVDKSKSRSDYTMETKYITLANEMFGKSIYINELATLLLKLDTDSLNEIEKILEQGLDDFKKALNLKATLIYRNIRTIKLASNEDERLGLGDINASIKASFNKIYYLGPLREEPKVFYRRLGSIDPLYVGHKGENVAFVLKYYSKKEISAILPVLNDPNWSVSKSEIIQCSLGQAVKHWLSYIGVADDIKVEEMGKLGLSIHANIHGDKDVDLVNVGVGVSQVLPLIVLGLASPQYSILLIEQPELHLHPFVQSRLGDFLICLSKLNKQVIAETHSEHLIHRMRLHVAKGNLDSNRDLSVYFTLRNEQSKESELLNIEIDEDGAINEWPIGFFDETQKQLDEILMANFEKYDI